MPISFGPFLYNTRALQILHERVLFLTNFVQRYKLSLILPNISIPFYTIGTVPTVYSPDDFFVISADVTKEPSHCYMQTDKHESLVC